MNRYTFNWTLAPHLSVEYAVAVPPFDAVARDTSLTLTATADSTDEQMLRERADQVAHDLARSLSYHLGERFEVAYGGYGVLTPGGGQRYSASISLVVLPAVLAMAGTVEVVARDAAGNVLDSSALQRERERQAMQQRLTDLTKRAAVDADLRDMLDHWRRYVADPDGRLHPLYDVLQVVERLYGGSRDNRKQRREKAALALTMNYADLKDLGDLTNNNKLLNGRHPGASRGPHRIATEAEVNTCERVAKAIIDNYAAKIVV